MIATAARTLLLATVGLTSCSPTSGDTGAGPDGAAGPGVDASYPPVAATSGISFARNGDSVDFNHRAIKLHVDEQLRLTIAYDGGTGVRSMTDPAVPCRIQLDGVWVSDFRLDPSRILHQSVRSALGSGQRVVLAGVAPGPASSTIAVALTLDLLADYPNTVFASAEFSAQGAGSWTIGEAWGMELHLNRRRLNPAANPYAFQMVSMGDSWGNALRDRIWSLGPSSSFRNYNGGDTSNPEFTRPWGGGGTPLTSVWSPEMATTIAVVEATPQVLGVPVRTRADGVVLAGVRETAALGALGAARTFRTVRASVTVHSGDFYAGVQTYGRAMRSLGIGSRHTDADYEPYWCSFGLEEHASASPGNPTAVDQRLYVAKDLGLRYVNIDSGWDDGTGSCRPNSRFFSSEAAFAAWIGKLHQQGLKVSLWWDPGFGDDSLRMRHPSWFIAKKDSTPWVDDWDRFAMDPAVSEALANVRACATKMLTPQARGGWGVDRLFLDGAFRRPPSYAGASPHDSERQDYLFYKEVHEVAQAIDPRIPIEICPCGGVITIWNAPYVTQFSAADPDVMEARPHEVRAKLYKALFGADTPVNGDHLEGAGIAVDMNYMFPLVLGTGAVYQTYYWGRSWNDRDALGVGVKSLYQKWFGLYRQLGLAKAEYRGELYDLANDHPGSHAIAKGFDMHYLFAPPYGASFSGDVELRGLRAGRVYRVSEYDTGRSWGTFTGPVASLAVRIAKNHPLVLVAQPISNGEP